MKTPEHRRSGILTLTTDFGADGPYVASMKGVILGLAPGSQLVDLSHAIDPQDIEGGSFVLAQVVGCFPAGTVHLAVVDPGVGTDRRLIVVEAADQWFVLPDNGLIGGVLDEHRPSGVWEIRNPKLWRSAVSSTFHGRDILAPVAAHLLRGGDPAEVGPALDGLIHVPSPRPSEADDGLRGEVVFVDRFGNLITNVGRGHLGLLGPEGWAAEMSGIVLGGLVRTYGERPPGSLVALVGGTDRVEVAEVNGDAARRLGAGRGTPILLRPAGRTTP